MEYFDPLSLQQAEKLKKKIAGSVFLAGGTTLNWRGAPTAKAVIDLKNLNLGEIKSSNSKIVIGAAVTIQEISESSKIPQEIKKAAGKFTSINVRNIATIGGTIGGGFFISHLLPVLAAYEAEVEYYSSEKKKIMPIVDWLRSKKGIITGITIKKLKRSVKIAEDKIAASDFPSMVTALGFDLRGGKISNAIIAVSGATGPLSISKNAANYLNGLRAGDADAAKLTRAAGKDIKTVGNIKVSSRVKRRMIDSHLTALLKALARR